MDARADSPDSAPLPYENADVVSVSRKGKLALVANRQILNVYTQLGTLERATLGGAPRDILENVQDADWMPDGSSLAVTFVDATSSGEFPIGHVVYDTSGWATDPACHATASGSRSSITHSGPRSAGSPVVSDRRQR